MTMDVLVPSVFQAEVLQIMNNFGFEEMRILYNSDKKPGTSLCLNDCQDFLRMRINVFEIAHQICTSTFKS